MFCGKKRHSVCHVLRLACAACRDVLFSAGASLPYDSVDLRILEETWTGAEKYGETFRGGKRGIIDSPEAVGGWPVLRQSTPPADTDNDGMPDAWETAQGLNPNSSADALDVHASGYTNLERYLAGNSAKPVLSAIFPASQHPAGTVATSLQVTTSANATCRYSKSSTATFGGMTPFSSTGSTVHSSTVTVEAGGSYRYHIKCLSTMGELSDAGVAAFSVEPMPVRQRRGWR